MGLLEQPEFVLRCAEIRKDQAGNIYLKKRGFNVCRRTLEQFLPGPAAI